VPRSHSRFQRTSGSRRRTAWNLGPRGTALSKTSAQTNVLSVGVEAGVEGITIVRLRGRFFVQLNAASAVDESFRWALGICVVTQNAAGIGATAIPEPVTDIGWDGWLFHSQGLLNSRDATPLIHSGLFQTYELDSKAMRKFKLTDVCVAVFQFLEVGACTISAGLESRMLVKLP